MNSEAEIEKLSDQELVNYSNEVIDIAKKKLIEVRTKYGVSEEGVLNSYGKGKEYLQVDLESYHKDFAGVCKDYIRPIEKEVHKRIKGDDEYYSKLYDKTYKFNIKKLEYFENNIKNCFIGRLSPNYCNPNWSTHMKKIARLFKQKDYQETLKKREIKKRDVKIKNILDEQR